MTAVAAAPLTSCLPERPSPPVDQPYKRDPGPYEVRQVTHTWHDLQRQRDIPVRIYYPAVEDAEEEWCFPVIIFSHGLVLSRDHYAYLGQHWASHGYIVVHLSHPGSDTAALKATDEPVAAIIQAAKDPANRRERPRDVLFAIDQLERDRLLGQVVDRDRIGVAGHSFGAFTALATVGMRVDLPGEPAAGFRDPRIRAAVAMSPQGPGVWGLNDDSWNEIATPCMSMMGTLDVDPLVVDAAARRAAFECCSGPDQFLVTIEGALHMAFDDKGLLLVEQPWKEQYHDYVRMATTAFFDAYLLDDHDAQRWLLRGSLEAYSSGQCRLEYKNVTTAGTN